MMKVEAEMAKELRKAGEAMEVKLTEDFLGAEHGLEA